MKHSPSDYVASSMDAMGKFLRRSNAMAPILAVILILAILCGVALTCSLKIVALVCLAYVVSVVLCITVMAFVGIFIYFAITNPRALQSEHLQITMRQMDLAVASKGQVPEIVMNDNTANMVEEISVDEHLDETQEKTGEFAVKEAK